MRMDILLNNNINEDDYYVYFSAHDNVSQNACFLSILDWCDGSKRPLMVKCSVRSGPWNRQYEEC